jgi:hypothetical protein
VFYDSSGCLKVYQKTSGDILTLEEGEHVEERRMLLMGPTKDRFLFRKSSNCLQEYTILHNTPKLSKEYFDDKQIIEDFCYYRSKGGQTGKEASSLSDNNSEYHVLIITQSGILRRVDTATGKSRKFEIDPEGDTFKICFCEFLSYILITFTRNQLDNIEQVAYVAAIDDSDIKFVNNVYFQTGVGRII